MFNSNTLDGKHLISSTCLCNKLHKCSTYANNNPIDDNIYCTDKIREPMTTTTTTAKIKAKTMPDSQLMRENQELRQRLAEEASIYRKRLDTYKQAQQNQATFVSRLQSKIQQYRRRCTNLEDRIQDTIKSSSICQLPKITSGPTSSQILCSTPLNLGHINEQTCSPTLESPSLPRLCTEDINDTITDNRNGNDIECFVHENGLEICHRLEEQHTKCKELSHENTILRRQLDESNRTNESLTNDLQKLTNDWSLLRDELNAKEDDFKEEEQAFKDYYSSEHNRLLKMWRDTVAVKRDFQDIQLAVKHQITSMNVEINATTKEIYSAYHNASQIEQQTKQISEKHISEIRRENDKLQSQLATLKIQHESANHEILERDKRLYDLMNQLKKCEDRCTQAESQAALANRYNDEIEHLNNSMREIAQAVLLDAELTDDDTLFLTGNDFNYSLQRLQAKRDATSLPLRLADDSGRTTKSPKRISTHSSKALAEGTISAVQAALHKYQLSLHDLQNQYQKNNEQLLSTKTQLDNNEATKSLLTTKVQQLTEKLDTSNHKLSELLKEQDNLQRTVEELQQQKQRSELNRMEINSAFETLSTDHEKLQTNYFKMQKKLDDLVEHKKNMEIEMQQLLKDKNMSEMKIRAEEDHVSRLREETISLREELKRVNLARELLEQQHVESDDLIKLLEKQKSDCEYNLDKVLLEKYNLQDRLEKISNNNNQTSDEIKVLQKNFVDLQDKYRKSIQNHEEQSNEMNVLRKELSDIEKLRLDLTTDNMSIIEKTKCLQLEKDKLLQDLTCLTRDRDDVHTQLTIMCRKKEAFNEEVIRIRQRLEQCTETNNRLNRNLEELVKNVEEKQCVINIHEKEIHRLQELLAVLRSEKDSLDTTLFNTNANLQASEEKRMQIERQLQEALVREEALKNNLTCLQKEFEQCQRRSQENKILLTNAARATENDFNKKITNLNSLADEATKKHTEDLELLRTSLEKRMQQALQALQTAKDDEIEKQQERLEGLQIHLENLVQQHEETLIRAENDKQQALLIAQRDRQTVIEKLETIAQNLQIEQEALEKSKKEYNCLEEKYHNTIVQLRNEIDTVRTKEEEQKKKLEENLRKQDSELNALKKERDKLMHECDELKMDLRIKEDKVESLNIELQETMRKAKEAESNIEILRKELTDTLRKLADSNIECEKYTNSNKELREHVKRVESIKRELTRSIEDSSQKISNLEENRNSIEEERTRLTNSLKETQSNLLKIEQELNNTKTLLQKTQEDFSQKNEAGKELQQKLNTEIKLKEKTQQELNHLKKQLVDLEENLCITRQELGRARCQANQEDHRFHSREKELQIRIEEFRGHEKRLEDQKHNLEVCLADATQQIQELKARLGGTESRLRVLDDQLICCENHKRNTEQKLTSIVHTLRRIAGIQSDGTINLPHRLSSPSRRFSPVRSVSGFGPVTCHDHDARTTSQYPESLHLEVDPDLIRKGVRNLMHQLAQIERDKDDFRIQLETYKKQLQTATEKQQSYETKFNKLQNALRQVQKEKCNLETEYNSKMSAINALEEKWKHKTDECKQLRDKLSNADIQLSSCHENNIQCEERLDKCRKHTIKIENDNRRLQDDLSKIESRATKLDLQRVAYEGEISRLQMAAQEKNDHNRQMQERLDNQNKTIVKLEDTCNALKTSLDQMKERLQKASLIESELRGELKAAHNEIYEKEYCTQTSEDKLKSLQKSLQLSENEKRILCERLEKSQSSLNEVRQNQQSQQDNIQRLHKQINELEVRKSTLESQLRLAKWNRETEENEINPHNEKNQEEELLRQLKLSQIEKNELREKVTSLLEKIRKMEKKFPEKNTHDCSDSNLIKTTSTPRHHINESFENCATFGLYNCGVDHAYIEQENRALRLKIKRLETLIAEKESELTKCKSCILDSAKCIDSIDSEGYRNVQKHAEKVLDAREEAHRQQVLQLENQISTLREQLSHELKRRQQYILRSSKANREIQHLRKTLDDSLHHVSQHPYDMTILENETRRLDNVTSTSLPSTTYKDYE